MNAIQRFLSFGLCSAGLLITLQTSAAHADGTVSVDLSPEGENLASRLGISVADFEDSLEQELATAFDTFRPKDYLRALSDAVAFSNRGIGVDYASGSNRFEMGVAGNVSVALGDKGFGEIDADRPVGGIAPNFSLMLGWNLAEFGHPALTLFANGFHHAADIEEFRGKATNAGLHAQYRLFRSRGGENLRKLIVQWGGLDITGGIEFTRLGLSLTKELKTDLPIAGLDAVVTSTGTYDLTATAITVPIEVTTSLRVFYFFWLYGGVGADLQLGGSTLDARLDGTMTAQDPNTQQEVVLGTASVLADESAGPSVGQARFLAGVQAEVFLAKLFVQGNFMPNRGIGIAFGLRAAF